MGCCCSNASTKEDGFPESAVDVVNNARISVSPSWNSSVRSEGNQPAINPRKKRKRPQLNANDAQNTSVSNIISTDIENENVTKRIRTNQGSFIPQIRSSPLHEITPGRSNQTLSSSKTTQSTNVPRPSNNTQNKISAVSQLNNKPSTVSSSVNNTSSVSPSCTSVGSKVNDVKPTTNNISSGVVLKVTNAPVGNNNIGTKVPNVKNSVPKVPNNTIAKKRNKKKNKKRNKMNAVNGSEEYMEQLFNQVKLLPPVNQNIDSGQPLTEWQPNPRYLGAGVISFTQRTSNCELITSEYPQEHRLLNNVRPRIGLDLPPISSLFVSNYGHSSCQNDDSILQQLWPGSYEFQQVCQKFTSTTQSHFQIIQINKVNNSFLQMYYLLKKTEYEILYGAENVEEKMLFHGTSHASAKNICKNNFNWRCYKNEKRYGHGVNFTSISNYASHYCDNDEPFKVMLLANVLICKSCDGNSKMFIPPHYNDQTFLRYDTSQKPNGHVHVKFNDDEFYPSYVIFFTGDAIKKNNRI